MSHYTTARKLEEYPFMKQKLGKPMKVFEKIGPFTLIVTNHGFYETYEVKVTDGVSILKQASRPGVYEIACKLEEACDAGLVSYKVLDEYKRKAREAVLK